MTTKARRALLRTYLLQLRDLMRLQAWDINVSDDPPDNPDSILSVVPHVKRWTATIYVGNFFAQERHEQRQVCVHEIVHLVQAMLWEWADDDSPWKDRVGRALADDIKGRVLGELENQADFLARIMAPSYPLPPAELSTADVPKRAGAAEGSAEPEQGGA